jgi:hypothetical protein
VALQGTIDTFAIPDVLRLLAATRKTGRLRVSGSRGSGAAWVEDGSVVDIEAAHAPHAGEPADALFELLRFEDGSFTFDVDLVCEDPRPACDVEDLLAEAEARLAEWREIEAVVPSLDAMVTLRRQLPGPEVTFDRERWATLVAIGAGTTVRRIGEELCLAELAVSRAVKDLVELGVAEVDTDLSPAPSVPTFVAATTAVPETSAAATSAPVTYVPSAVSEPGQDGAPGPGTSRADTSHGGEPAPRGSAVGVDEVRMIEGDDELNRGLLLKFLSSVKT